MNSSISLRITPDLLDQAIRRLTARPADRVYLAAGINRRPAGLELLIDSTSTVPTATDQPVVVLVAADEPGQLQRRFQTAVETDRAEPFWIVLALGLGPIAGQIIAGWCDGLTAGTIEFLTIPGSGLPTIRLGGHVPAADDPGNPEPRIEQHSRTIGALGENDWRRLVDLDLVIAGSGRTGSAFALQAVVAGTTRVTIIDPDSIEPHNLGEMLVPRNALGRPKAEVVIELARTILDVQSSDHRAIVDSIWSLPALGAVKSADLLVCCVDNPIARVVAACLARIYLRPLLDIGTGIFGRGADRQLGADIRLILPDRCLLCFGSTPDLQQARDWLANPVAAFRPRSGDFRQERAGSLLSLNQLAVSLGQRLIEDLVAGRITASRWLRVDYQDATPRIETLNPDRDHFCPLCRIGALGDHGIERLRTMFP